MDARAPVYRTGKSAEGPQLRVSSSAATTPEASFPVTCAKDAPSCPAACGSQPDVARASETPWQLTLRKALLDPRTKLALLILLAVFCLGGAGGTRLELFRAALGLLPFILMIIDCRRTYGAVLFVVLLACSVYTFFLFSGQGGVLESILVLLSAICARLIPCLALASYAMATTTVSQFIASMERLHCPDALTIPLSVMFRFFPAISENARAIGEAMHMRGISARTPGKYVEYRLVPLVECTTRSADDLASCALIRGLGAPVPRTDIAAIEFGAGDVAVALYAVGALIVSLVVSA